MTKQFSKEEQFNGVLSVYKRPGETPLECLNRLRIERPEFQDATLSYVGRLDPLASGVLLVVAGDENKKRDQYLSLSKEYKIEVLLGVATDTYDVLGLITEHKIEYPAVDEEQIKKVLNKYVGEMSVPYPMYSSKPVDGKPLFAWAKEGKSDEVDVPETKLKISSISFDGVRSVSSEDIHTYIKESVNAVNGDFRQDAILGKWNDFFADDKTRVATFTVVSLTVNCESGSYMRSLAVEIGKDIGAPALALKIVRTRVGEYCAENFNK